MPSIAALFPTAKLIRLKHVLTIATVNVLIQSLLRIICFLGCSNVLSITLLYHFQFVNQLTLTRTSTRENVFNNCSSRFGTSDTPCNRFDASKTDYVRVLNSSSHRKPLHSRRCTVPSVPEGPLCLELCGALQGLEGSYFRRDARGYLRIRESCSLSESQKSVVESMLSVSHLYADVVRIPSDHNKDHLVQAFLLSSQEVLEDYLHDIGDIPVYCRPLCLLRMLSMVENWRDRLIILHRLYNLRNEKGKSLLELLYTVYSPVKKDFVVDKVLECCASVLCRSINRWMSGCEVKECDFPMISSSSCDGYSLSWVPPFFPMWVAQYMVKIGKSWKSVDLQKNTENLDKARAIIATQLSPTSLYVQDEQHKLELVVREVCQLVCGSVVRSFVFDHHLIAHLDIARCFLLLHDSQFSHALYQQFWLTTLPILLHVYNLCNHFDQSIDLKILLVEYLETLKNSKLYPFLKLNSFGTYDKSDDQESVNLLRLLSCLLSTCERAILRLRIYITVVVEQCFNRLCCWIDDAIDLDAVTNAHKVYLEELTSSFFLRSDMEDIYGFIMSLLQISHELTRHCLEITADEKKTKENIENGNVHRGYPPTQDTQLLVIKAKLQKIFDSKVCSTSLEKHEVLRFSRKF
ncbi:hypothetical protein DICVIV_05072 [Dictyocaulus viviparus]|uniref:Uncharacterized protein n=1 Tax=Dictyocaulus viviparus TaxID=29172 RepID=A0A0D8XYJ1_DICVI|nr:hypothetical protein DICVIV_05072 [Dictyocaulus viviparus]